MSNETIKLSEEHYNYVRPIADAIKESGDSDTASKYFDIGLVPLDNWIFVLQDVFSETFSGTRILRNTAADKENAYPVTGLVLATSENEDIPVSQGQRILFNSFAGQEFTHMGQKIIAMKAHDPIGIFNVDDPNIKSNLESAFKLMYNHSAAEGVNDYTEHVLLMQYAIQLANVEVLEQLLDTTSFGNNSSSKLAYINALKEESDKATKLARLLLEF